MLDLWRLHAAHMPPVADASCARADAIDSSAFFTAELNRWYRRLLLEAPDFILNVRDIAPQVVLPPAVAADASTPLSLPESVVRVFSVRLRSWMRPARIATDPSDPLILRQLHPYTRATASRPVAIFSDGELRLYPAATATDSVDSLRCVSFSDGVYEFDDSALAGIHPY